MRSLLPAVRTGDRARLDGGEAKRSAAIGEDASEAAKGIRRDGFLAMLGMRVLALRIRLPDFQDPIVDRLSVTVGHAAPDADSFSGHSGGRDGVDQQRQESDPEIRADRL
jgi:hypothetical protein